MQSCLQQGGGVRLPCLLGLFVLLVYVALNCSNHTAGLNNATCDSCHVCAGVNDDGPESVLCCVWFPGDLSLGCHGGLSPAWAQAAGLPRGLCRCFCWGTGGCCNGHSSWKVGGIVYSPGVCGVSETLWSLSKMETNYFSLLILASSLVLAVFICVCTGLKTLRDTCCFSDAHCNSRSYKITTQMLAYSEWVISCKFRNLDEQQAIEWNVIYKAHCAHISSVLS